MEYKINPNSFSAMFPLPISVSDEHIRLAGTMQLRVIIWLFRHSAETPVSSKEMGKALGMVEGEIEDALQFWIEKGIVIDSNSVASPKNLSVGQNIGFSELNDNTPLAIQTQKSDVPQENTLLNKQTEKRVEKIQISLPTHEEVGRRIKESNHIRELMQVTEEIIGPLSVSMQSVLVSLHDDYGLGVEVISYLIEFLRTKGKITTSRLSNEGRKWCEMGIDTIENAEEYIQNHGAVEKSWEVFREKAGIKNPSLTKKQREFFETWVCKMHFSTDMILLAYDEMAERTGGYSFPYMNTILTGWNKSGISTVFDAKKAKIQRSEKYKKDKIAKNDTEKTASYDAKAPMKKAFENPLYRKKEGEP